MLVAAKFVGGLYCEDFGKPSGHTKCLETDKSPSSADLERVLFGSTKGGRVSCGSLVEERRENQ